MVNTPPKGTTSYLDYKYGFRDAKFEMTVEQFVDMTPDVDSSKSLISRPSKAHVDSNFTGI
jgi:hypothetical protein